MSQLRPTLGQGFFLDAEAGISSSIAKFHTRNPPYMISKLSFPIAGSRIIAEVIKTKGSCQRQGKRMPMD